MEISSKVEGLEDAMRAVRAAFPRDPEQQRRLLNQSMSGAAKTTIIPVAKTLSLRGDGSGSLSEAIKPRAVSKGKALARGATASVQVTPVRGDRKAIAKYIQFYYNSRGLAPPSSMVTDGIRHGHLVEFGHATRNGGFVAARPFMWPAVQQGGRAYINRLAASLKKKVEAAVRRKRRR